MKKTILYTAFLAVWTLTSISVSVAGEVSIPNTFQSGATAMASEVNANFTAVKTAVDDNDDRIAELEALVAALQASIEELAGSNVMALDPYVSVDEDSDDRGPMVQLSGVNFQIVNGLGSTDSVNGLGNLLIGYDETNTWSFTRCSDGSYSDQTSCEGAGAVWSTSHKSGSHYLVLGSENNYSQYGGLVAGYQNFVNRAYASVTGGNLNTASGEFSIVTGGNVNFASGLFTSVSGGGANSASGDYSSISGGHQSAASGEYSSVSGGNYNHASGSNASIAGGRSNTASGIESSVDGGSSNLASGRLSSVSGGGDNIAGGDYSSVSGGGDNRASGSVSSVSGGENNEAGGYLSSVSGGYDADVSGTHDWAAGGLFEDE